MFALLYFLVPLIALLYASIGFGGATGYLAIMSFFGVPSAIMASTALMLNIIVASISFASFYKAGHFYKKLLLPFLVTSIPAAFIGGYLKITDRIYFVLLYAVLTLVAIRLLVFSQKQDDNQTLHPIQLYWALAIGFGIGLLSGMVGVGGGIFLSPVIIFAHWGTPKQASAVAAMFIVINSISGLTGRLLGGTFVINSLSLSLIPLGVVGALAGSYLGSQHLSVSNLRRVLGFVMSLAVSNFWLAFWR